MSAPAATLRPQPAGTKRKTEASDNDSPAKKIVHRRKAACQTCRLRKVKCDQTRPVCGLCKLSGSDCVFDNNSDGFQKLDPSTEIIIDRLDEVLNHVKSLNSIAQSRRPRLVHSDSSVLEEPTRDYLKIPWGRATADAVLLWPIFQGQFLPNSLIDYFFQDPSSSLPRGLFGSPFGSKSDAESLSQTQDSSKAHSSVSKDAVPELVDRFLQNVHTKNPILDVDGLVLSGRRISRDGFEWDANSCLVLLACALGAVSHPFSKAFDIQQPTELSSATLQASELRTAEEYFTLASRRFGLLKFTIVGAQCHFFAGVYLMYTLRQLQSWNHFHQAAVFFQLYLQSVGGPSGEDPSLHDSSRLQRISRLQRRLEQSLYWSCFKSEVEMRVELPLVQSDISSFEYPDPFPSPPTPPLSDSAKSDSGLIPSLRPAVDATYSSSIRKLRSEDESTTHTDDAEELRRHSRDLYNEAESWYYYLSEVALRRISNRVVNTFFNERPTSWMRIQRWLSMALEFDNQISTWSANLPNAMQSFEDSWARLCTWDTGTEKATNGHSTDQVSIKTSVSREMSWCIENRILEMRSWLYQPFLYYVVHHRSTDGHNLTYDEEQALDLLIRQGVECNIKILLWRSLPHRHHGIWFDLRAVVTATLILNAVARSNPQLVPTYLFDYEDDLDKEQTHSTARPVSFATAFKRLRYWEVEAPDIRRARVLMEKLVEDTRIILHSAESY